MTFRLAATGPARGRQWVAAVILVAGLVALWQIVVVALALPPYLLPSPVAVGHALVTDWRIFAFHTATTLGEVVLGLVVGIALGLGLAIVMNQSAALERALYVPILATQTTPVVAIAPILIVWLGVGLLPKVIIIAVFSFFPVLVNTTTGLQATGRQMVTLLDSVGATQWQIYRTVRIPMALPHVFAGVRLAAAASVVGAIVIEWVASSAGLGYLLILYQSRLNMDKAFATLVLLLVLGLGIFALFAALERHFSWQKRLGVE